MSGACTREAPWRVRLPALSGKRFTVCTLCDIIRNMREITPGKISSALAEAIDYALKHVDADVVQLLRECRKYESGAAAWAIDTIIANDELAAEKDCYACQDTGVAMIFADVGEDVRVRGLEDAINEGVRRGYRDARKSIAHPLSRINTGDNTPAVIHTRIVSGDRLTIGYLAKGAGSENMCRVYMLPPSAGRRGIIDSVVDCVTRAGANPCPPVILGIGIGGTMDAAAVAGKRALLRKAGAPSDDKDTARLESEILRAVNATGIGAQGFGGKTTALYAAIETVPTHIGMLPVAVTVQCHSARHASITL